jgi:hypothetical protein
VHGALFLSAVACPSDTSLSRHDRVPCTAASVNASAAASHKPHSQIHDFRCPASCILVRVTVHLVLRRYGSRGLAPAGHHHDALGQQPRSRPDSGWPRPQSAWRSDSDTSLKVSRCRPVSWRGRAASYRCLTARQELSRQRVGLASPDNSDTHDSNAGRGPASTRPQDWASVRPARPARQRRRSYKLHISGCSTLLEASCGGISGGPELAELQATQWRRRKRTEAGGHRGSPQPESRTGGGAARARTRRAGVYAPLDWDNLPGRATRLLQLE